MEAPNTAELIGRALRLRCPNCGVGRVYSGLKQNDGCTHCHYRYEREYGYFLGALIVTYAVIGGGALLAMILLIIAEASTPIAIGLPLVVGIVLVPLFTPFSHTLWMAIDLRFDPPKPEDFETPEAGSSKPLV